MTILLFAYKNKLISMEDAKKVPDGEIQVQKVYDRDDFVEAVNSQISFVQRKNNYPPDFFISDCLATIYQWNWAGNDLDAISRCRLYTGWPLIPAKYFIQALMLGYIRIKNED